MLYSVETGKVIKQVPHLNEFNFWRSKLTIEQYDYIIKELNNRLDTNEVHTSSWIPGKDWSDTPFEAIYEACDEDQENAAKFFGLILWETIMNREEYWSFGHYEKNGIPIQGITYFRIDKIEE